MNGRVVLSSRRISPAWRGQGSGPFVCGGVMLAAAALFFIVWRMPRSSQPVGARPYASRVSLSATMTKNAAQKLGNLGWVFERNVGQVSSSVKFLARAKDATVFLTDDGIDISWATSTRKANEAHSADPDSLELTFSGSNPGSQPVGETLLPGKTNYLIGPNPRAWHTNIPHYAAVRYAGLYSGVDARFYGGTHGLEFDLTAAGDADLRRILLRARGADALHLDSRGDLVMRVGARQLTMKRPRLYQLIGTSRVDVSGGYRLVGGNTIGLNAGKHRSDLPLVIDPAISVAYTTFLGGNGAEKGNSVAVAPDAVTGDTDAFVGGTTTDISSFPETTTCNDIQSPTCGGATSSATSNLFVAKVDLSTTPPTLVYLTFIGGSGNDQGGLVAVDNSPASASPPGSPNLAVLGWTTSANFPTTLGTVPAGTINLTVSKLNGAGNAFVYSEYYGGSGMEATQGTGAIVSNSSGGGIATDSAGDVFVTSDTTSIDLPQPGTPNGFQTMFEGTGAAPIAPNNDGFLAKFDPSGSLLYSTYFGITATVGSTGVAVDGSGNAYLTGFTSAPTTFPAVNPFQASYAGGNSDAFVMEVNPAVSGSSGLVYSTLLGGTQTDQALSIAVDTSTPANVYLTGLTQSPDLIPPSGITNAPFQSSLGSGATQNSFFAVISQSGGVPALQYITYLGGSGADSAQGVSVISPTQVYVAGTTTSSNFPSICSLQGFTGTQDAFLAQFNPSVGGTSSLLGTTLLGGTVTADANAVGVDALGNVIIFGDTISPDFPLAGNPNTGFQPICASCAATPPLPDAVLTKVTVNANPSGCPVFNPAVANFGPFADGTTSPPVNVLVTNDGSANLNVSSATITGANSTDFSLTINTCPASSPIVPGKTCDLSITFAPSIVGPETASLQISDDGIGSPQVLTLNGTGTGVGVTLSPGNTLNFPNTAQGQVSAPQSVSLTNTGTDNLNINQVPFSGTNPTDFGLGTSNTCASTQTVLAPGATCTIAVQFSPNEASPPAGGLSLSAQDSLSVTDTVNNSTQTVTVSLSGTEIPATPAIVFAPTSLTFTSENVGSATAAQPITLTNTGSAPLAISSIGVTGTDAGDFPETNTCPTAPTTIAINGTCTISVKFQPTGTGPRSASVSVSDNANSSPQTVALAGTGTAAGVTLTPLSLTFAGQNPGTPPSTPQTVTLQNTGSGPLTISSISITGANPGDFAETNNCPGSSVTLNVNQACAIAITFAPTGTGPRSASLTVADDAVPSPQLVSLNGTGTMPVAHLNLSNGAFASEVVGGVTASLPVQVSNTGNGPLVITNVGFTGANPGDFQASGGCVGSGGSGVSVAPGLNCTVNVAFAPTATGSRSASLSVTDNAANSPQQVSVTGTATDFQLGVGAGGNTSTTITAGETATFNLQATPVNNFAGTVAMSCTDPISASTCTVAPQQVVVSAIQPSGFSVTVTTTARSALPQIFRKIPPRGRLFLIGFLLLVLAFLWLWNWMQRRRPRFRLAFLLAGALLLCSCGGGGSNPSSTGTPAGTYVVVATGTISGTSRTVNMTITVQ